MAPPSSRALNRELTEKRILDAALSIFSQYGYRGATIDQIAHASGLSKPNLLYYFRRKQDIYTAVLDRLLDDWLAPLEQLDADGDPAEQLLRYIETKLDASKQHPEASRLFATEIINGAPILRPYLEGPLSELVDQKSQVLRSWIRQGRMRAVDPRHYLFAIWSTTQHYGDFEVQVGILTRADKQRWSRALQTLKTLLVDSVII